MPSYTGADGTTILWDDPRGEATVMAPDGTSLTVSLDTLLGMADLHLTRMRDRLDAKDRAIRVLCHDLRGGATALIHTAELVQRYAERGDVMRATERATDLVNLVRERVVAIQAGEALALGVVEAQEER